VAVARGKCGLGKVADVDRDSEYAVYYKMSPRAPTKNTRKPTRLTTCVFITVVPITKLFAWGSLY
jgi:hypothetical protein